VADQTSPFSDDADGVTDAPRKRRRAPRHTRSEQRTYWYIVERKSDDGTLDIDFQVVDPDCPAAHRTLKQDIERALSTINALYAAPKDHRKRSEAFAKLLALSRVGMVGPSASPEIASDALRALEADITNREVGPVKNAYMRKLGVWAGGFAAISLGMFFFCDHFPQIPLSQVYKYRHFFVLWTGCMVGTWASFASRRVALTFHDLVALEEDRIEPALRLVFAGTLTTILGLVFVTGMADVELGSFSASGLVTSGSVAFLTGAFAGISEKVLPSAILSRATSIIPKGS
jgi:hypothetical protein